MTRLRFAPWLMVGGLCTTLAAQTLVAVDLDRRHQTIEGFGSCLISWDPEMEKLYATSEFQDAFLGQLGASMLRINLWGPCLPRPVEDWRDIRCEEFQLDGEGHRVRMFLDAAKRFRAVDPKLRLIGTVWSPPAWMKENGAIVDTISAAIDGTSYVPKGRRIANRVRPACHMHFVKWLVEMVKLHEAHGVPLHAVSPGNEVMFTQTFESCVWTAADFATIVALLGKQLAEEGLGDVLVFGPETMTGGNWGKGLANDAYVQAIERDDAARRYLTRWATHGYTDGFVTDTNAASARGFWDMIKDTQKPFWITESGTGTHPWPGAMTGIGAMIHNALVEGNASAFVAWQATEREPSEHALMVGTALSGKSRAAQHYFKFVRPGAVRVETTPATGRVPASAFLHEADDVLTIVLANPVRQQVAVTLALSGGHRLREMQVHRTSNDEQCQQLAPAPVRDDKLELTLPGESMVTLRGERTR